MKPPVEARISLVVEGIAVHEAPMSYESLTSVVSGLPDIPENAEFFEKLAEHASSQVREQVAYKENINEATVLKLAKDESVNVIRNLARTTGFRRYITDDLVMELLDRDVEIACHIAQNFESLENIDRQKLTHRLLSSADPAVFAALAGNYATPKKIIKELIKHPDPYVASEAKRTLDN
jgi:hypothetical protein